MSIQDSPSDPRSLVYTMSAKFLDRLVPFFLHAEINISDNFNWF